MKLATIRNKSVTSKIDFEGDETLTLTHNPAAFTPKLEMELTGERRTTRDLAVFINALVTGWDLVQEDGTPFPLSVEALCELPIDFLGKVVEKVSEDNNPNASKTAPTGSFS